MRVLITGLTGFVGSHLAEFALSPGAEVAGGLRWRRRTGHIEQTLTDLPDYWRRRLASQPA